MNKNVPAFLPLSEGGAERVLDEARSLGIDFELLREVIDSFSDADAEIAVSLLCDALLVRIYDGKRYLFLSPVGLADPWDIRGALAAVRDYAVREMIPLCFTDVMREELEVYTGLFRFVDARSYEDDDDLFFLRVTSECDSLDRLPELSLGRVRLAGIRDEDGEIYRGLCESRKVNRYWGYDAREDNPDGGSEYYLSVARGEFANGVAVTLGVYLENTLIGEGVLYAFDMSGGASVALRLLPEYQGMGLGSETLSALIRIAKNMGLLYLSTEVMLENAPSIAMTEKQMPRISSDGERAYFRFEL